MRASRLSLAAWFALAVAAHAEPCGTVVLPSGLGASSPNPVTGLNPLIGSSLANGEIENVIFRPVLWVGRQADVDWSLSIATSVDVSDDGLTWHVAMGDWRWSDGAPITADDVAYCLEMIRRMGDLWPGKGYGDMPDVIRSLDVTGPRSFDVTLAHPTSRRGFLLNGLSALVPLPRHAWRDASVDEMWRRQTDLSFFDVVSGPYKVTRLELGRYATLEANPAYSGPVKPAVERVVVSFLEGENDLRALEAGEIDAADVPLALWEAATALPGLRVVEPPQGYSFNYIGLNFQNPAVSFFGDLRVRQAMADAIDPARVISLAYHGQGYDMRGPVPPQLASLLGAEAPRETVRFDPERARRLLDEAGWAPGADGVRRKDGRRLSFTLIAATELPAQALVDQIVQRELAEIGVEMRVEEMAFTQLLALIYGPKSGFEAFHILLFFGPWPDGGPMFGTGGANNNGGWSDARMDEIGARMHVSDDAALLREYQEYVGAEQPVIFLPDEKVVLLARPGLEGLADFLYPNGTWAPENLRLAGDKECDARRHQPS
jgi:peptide/nickel transport system substrate-binding protein